jgi:hypothetical protein
VTRWQGILHTAEVSRRSLGARHTPHTAKRAENGVAAT